MMGSLQDAEDMVQETLLRAWQRRETYQGRATLRAWLYRIATNLCLDSLRKRPRRAVPVTYQEPINLSEPLPPGIIEPIWLEPIPDRMLPEGHLAARETISLAFLTALHLLPPRQRAVLILRDVLELSARESASLLEMTISAVKSALHRARSTLAQAAVPPPHDQALDEATQSILTGYVQAWEAADVDGLLQLLTEDAAFSMPPTPAWYRGREVIGGFLRKTLFGGGASGRWRLIPARANRQAAYGLYRIAEDGSHYTGYGIQLVTLRNGKIADMTTFHGSRRLLMFNLPDTLPNQTESPSQGEGLQSS
jgi:RNA polymerase sigma-70 factor (ECF subfamily)